MCDFSQYGPISDEFLELQKTLPPVPELSLQELKVTTNKGREKASQDAMKTLASSIEMEDYQILTRDGSTVSARTYRSKSASSGSDLPLYIHFHGGGFLFGTLDSEDAACALVALGADVVVLNVEYRHTPEFKYPTPFNDAEDAFEWSFTNAETLRSDASRIIVGGISAGASLTAALVQTKHREQTASSASIVGQVLMIPCVVHSEQYAGHLQQMKTPEISSYKQNEFAPILPKTRLDTFNGLMYSSPPDYDDRRACPGNAPSREIKGLPPAVFGIAGADPLRDEGLLYAQLLASNGVPTNVHVYKGLPHGYRRFGKQLEAASGAWDSTITNGIRWVLGKPQAVKEINVQVH